MRGFAFTGLALVCVIFLNIDSAQAFNSREAARIFQAAREVTSSLRRAALELLGNLDRDVIEKDVGEQQLKSQVSGNTEYDFNFEDMQEYSQSITRATVQAQVKQDVFDPDGTISRMDEKTEALTTEANNGRQCPFDQFTNPPCDTTTFYREPNGRCNNLIHKTWGMAGSTFGRRTRNNYQDGLNDVRVNGTVSGKPLPNPRDVSREVTRTNVILDPLGFSAQLMQWGQFMAHELTSIADTEQGAVCCPELLARAKNGGNDPTQAQIDEAREDIRELRGDVCIAVEKENDPSLGNVCMTQVRSATSVLEGCKPSPRLQMNTATHFVDASAIYGSSTSAMDRLREKGTGGRLASQTHNGKELPPFDNDRECEDPAKVKCPFAAGDNRINTTPNLASLHTVFLRKHNEIVGKLAEINPRWGDERLFQEARRIITAIQQNIHYNEWLQHLLGDKLEKYNLKRESSTSFENTYDATVNPSLLIELASAGLRFGHSTVSGRFTAGGNPFGEDLAENFERPDLVYDRGVGACMRGLSGEQGDRPWRFDRFFTPEMRERLFRAKLDIVTLNVNRGRDHGLPTYVQAREAYGLSVPKTFDDMLSTHPAEVVTDLKRIYDNVGDVDLYIAGVTENKQSNGYIGDLFAEILGDGFSRLKRGDRFFFTTRGSGFTIAQVNNLRRYSFSKLICEAGDLPRVAPDAFRRPQDGNLAVDCDSLPGLDLNLWKSTVVDPPTCSWKRVGETSCCNGRRTIHRQCIGGDSCKPGSRGCEGRETVRVTCSCPIYNPRCGTRCNITSPTTRRPSTRKICLAGICIDRDVNPLDVLRGK